MFEKKKDDLQNNLKTVTPWYKNKKVILTGAAGVAIVACVFGVIAWNNVHAFKVTDTTLELGETLAKDESFIMNADLDNVTLDVSGINNLKEGTYEATATYNNHTKSFQVEVVDTTAPEITLSAEDAVFYVAVNTEVPFETIATTLDLNGCEISYEDASNLTDEESLTLLFSETGEYKNTIIATDNAGNSSKCEIVFYVGNPPTISGVEDMEVTIGSDVDYLNGVSAVDQDGNDLTSQIEVDSSLVDLTTAGEYTVNYSVTDSHNFSSTASCIVTVVEPDESTVASTGGTSGSGDSGSVKSASNSNSSSSTSSASSNESTSSGESYWGVFARASYIMSEEDTNACDAIAKSYMRGEISAESCASQLQVYQDKYRNEAYQDGVSVAANGVGVNTQWLSNMQRIYGASWSYYGADGTVINYEVVF